MKENKIYIKRYLHSFSRVINRYDIDIYHSRFENIIIPGTKLNTLRCFLLDFKNFLEEKGKHYG